MSVASTSLPFGGTLSEAGLESVLLRVSRDELTGILTVQGEEDIISLSIESGAVVGADALNESLETGLGRTLVDEGLISAEQLSAVLESPDRDPGRLSETLVAGTDLSQDDYLSGLRSYTLELIRRGCSWRRGEYKFFGGDEVAREDGFEPIRAEEVCSADAEPASNLELEAEPGVADVVAEPVVLHPASLEATYETPEAPAVEESVAAEEPVAAVDLVGLPPADSAAELEAERVGPRQRALRILDRVPEWIGTVLPLAAMVLLVAVLSWGPNLILYPGFWLEPERLAFEQQTRMSVYLKIDRAAKTFFLLEGRFPEDLQTLVARNLLSSGDVVGSGGRLLRYHPGDRGYRIPPAADGIDPGINHPEAIAGDFFLDPEYVVRASAEVEMPLVLLD